MKLTWTRLALADLDNAYEYISEDRPSAALDVIERIEKALEALRKHSYIGRPGRIEGTRELVISGTPFVIPYRIRHSQVELLAVMHGARRWPDGF